ncbi:MAG: transglycosylase SLT domain-containing protein [Tildeniella nuda ZEHNDER 1965/U140]|jgi:soluble lytic murein transglycosylase|nr:transglycosylase SLT domain-containing protein [Tildeniella nuda ZEHNDER 1965/U140]
MLKQRKTQVWLGLMALGALAVGAVIPVMRWSDRWHEPSPIAVTTAEGATKKQVGAFKALPPAQRTKALEAIVKGKESPERSRARYLLATELIEQGQGKKALEPLHGLENSYPALAAHVLKQRAQAYEQVGDRDNMQATRQQLLKDYPKNPVAAEALVALGRDNPRYGDQAIAQFPAHPSTIGLVQQRLKQNPKQPQLLLLVAKHALYAQNYTDVLDDLTSHYASQLQPNDWEAIAFGYWEKQLYGKAGAAYARAPYTPLNAYRVGRGFQLGEKGGAIQAYQRVIQTFPTASETALALLRLAKLSEPVQAVSYLDQVAQRFPAKAGEALLEKAKLLEQQNSLKFAAAVRQILLTRYSKSDAAAELRWSLAQERGTANDAQAARVWAESLMLHNPNSEQAPEATYWSGKWAEQLGRQTEAKTAYEQVLAKYPQSYYAWRSASRLGWDVGDFTSVRQLKPAVIRPASRPDLPVGSTALKELFQLGQDRDAWRLWQVEFQDPMQPSVAEQFTDGVMRLSVGDYLDGIFMVSFLQEREKPEEQSQYRSLKQQASYWQALYPFPFLEPIETWSQERQLNPLLVTALIRQESRFMPGIRSSVGATGLMQVMPDTGAWIAKQIKLKTYQLNDPDDNIKLGTWYLDYTHQEYSGNSMLAIASYNAGPGAVGGWVAKAGQQDPDVFVENIPYAETKGYVKSVFENYWNYLRLYNPDVSQKLTQLQGNPAKLTVATPDS